MVTGTRQGDNAISAVGISVPAGVDVQVSTEGQANQTYLTIAEPAKGNRAYGVDGDTENTMYFVQNENWKDSGGIDCAAPPITLGVNDFEPAVGGGGAPNANWAVLE
jgi:hypothetical protein